MLFPHSRQQHTDKMKEDHQLAITGIQRVHQLFIENWNNQIQAIHYENVALQAQRDVYQAQLQRCQDSNIWPYYRCHVPRANVPR